MYEMNTILIGANLLLNAAILGAVLGIWRVKLKMAKAQDLVNKVGPVPIPPPPRPVEPLQQIQQPVIDEPVAETPAEVKGGKQKKLNPKAQKQIELLKAELERLEAM